MNTEVSPEIRFETDVMLVLNGIKKMLLEKNRKYGDAALNPHQVFSRASAIELIDARIDDKLSRIKNRQSDDAEDPMRDLLGYLVLREIAVMRAETPVKPMPMGPILREREKF